MNPNLLQAIWGTVAYDARDGSWHGPLVQRKPQISVAFRCKLTLMIFDQYAYGDHVVDDRAFITRCRRLPWLV